MTFDPKIYHRRSTRLQEYDHSWPGWYYVTISTNGKLCYFGTVENDLVRRSSIGAIAHDYWLEVPKHHGNAELDDFIVMNNHVHGIIVLDAAQGSIQSHDIRGDVQLNVPTKAFSLISPERTSLSVIVRTYKAAVTTWAKGNRHGEFAWQQRFHDHVVRNEVDLDRIRTYIRNNPLQWALDEENPDYQV